MSREAAAEFSFFLAIPTLLGASVFTLTKSGMGFSYYEWLLLLVGTIVSFVVALLVIAFFMNYLRTKKLAPFAYYLIALGITILFLLRW
ncbi:MAG: hypothetical protein CVU90_07150 [Firmicutes bacterium HGW-Firmicutes-15]|nr:MAG: hypothetical protein CVU90_07150 [Firmicutes bacterium HGW-Firmicutes-15]